MPLFCSYVSTHLIFFSCKIWLNFLFNVISFRELFEVAATPKSQQKPDAMDSITLVELVTMKDKDIKETLKLGMHAFHLCICIAADISSVVWRNFCICIWYVAEPKISFYATERESRSSISGDIQLGLLLNASTDVACTTLSGRWFQWTNCCYY